MSLFIDFLNGFGLTDYYNQSNSNDTVWSVCFTVAKDDFI